MVLIQGNNGQGKSNLLEAIYMLAIAKSPRASSDRELISWHSSEEQSYARVALTLRNETEDMRLQVDFSGVPISSTREEGTNNEVAHEKMPERSSVQKYFRVNGVPRRASELVGRVNAVMFSATDLELVYGSPTVRRRYLDILISQTDNHYMRALLRYQRVLHQRNNLLRMVRDGRSATDELDFWDEELITEAKHIMACRFSAVQRLSELSDPVHRELTGGDEGMELCYRPSVPVGLDNTEDGLAHELRRAMEVGRQREYAQGFTVFGPHRDDLQVMIENMDVGLYASRGQSRTAVLAMKVAEACYLTEQRQQAPILLLDDVLSELDLVRRINVLERASEYQQCFLTTTDVSSLGDKFLSQMSKFIVSDGHVEAVNKLPL